MTSLHLCQRSWLAGDFISVASIRQTRVNTYNTARPSQQILQYPLHLTFNLRPFRSFRNEREVDRRFPSSLPTPSEFQVVRLLDRRTFVDEVLLRQFVENLHHDGMNVFGSGHVTERF
jgi:hypothetical protein